MTPDSDAVILPSQRQAFADTFDAMNQLAASMQTLMDKLERMPEDERLAWAKRGTAAVPGIPVLTQGMTQLKAMLDSIETAQARLESQRPARRKP